ncbi:MAG: hypothetical protein AB7N76_29625 [Planctomycetota bacterium]
MELKKARDYRFTFQDAHGKLRVVYLQAQHFQEDGQDSIRLQATTDGVPLESAVFVDPELTHRAVTDPTELSAG